MFSIVIRHSTNPENNPLLVVDSTYMGSELDFLHSLPRYKNKMSSITLLETET